LVLVKFRIIKYSKNCKLQINLIRTSIKYPKEFIIDLSSEEVIQKLGNLKI